MRFGDLHRLTGYPGSLTLHGYVVADLNGGVLLSNNLVRILLALRTTGRVVSVHLHLVEIELNRI